MYEVKMPQWGMNMTEGAIVAWHKQEGDAVAAGEPLADIEAAKATNTLDAPVSGIVSKLVGPLDEEIPINTVIALIEDA